MGGFLPVRFSAGMIEHRSRRANRTVSDNRPSPTGPAKGGEPRKPDGKERDGCGLGNAGGTIADTGAEYELKLARETE